MVKGFVIGLIVGIVTAVVWHDSIQEYVKDNLGPARAKADDVLRTVQETSEGLLDGAKEQISSTLETARDQIRPVRSADAPASVGA